MSMQVKEVTEKNKEYVKQIADLEEVVLAKMIKDGREGQLFTTGYDDIMEYVCSDENSVYIEENEAGDVLAAAYITQGQLPFTYNDITKYFKLGDDYKNYLVSRYGSPSAYLNAMIGSYTKKLQTYYYAAKKVLKESTFSSISEYLISEIKENEFHEKSVLRNNLNKYMAEYAQQHFTEEEQADYERFFYYTISDMEKSVEALRLEEKYEIFCFSIVVRGLEESINLFGADMLRELDKILTIGQPTVYEEPNFDITPYYEANTTNSVEIDTYITNPNYQSNGSAKILVFEGIKKHIEKFFADPKNQAIYLCSTLHRDNFPSKYVSEFFGLIDNLFVNRRQGIDREVHMVRVTREEYKTYLEKMACKLATFYQYNPENKKFDPHLVKQVIEEQRAYEEKEVKRLQGITDLGANEEILKMKMSKVENLQNM